MKEQSCFAAVAADWRTTNFCRVPELHTPLCRRSQPPRTCSHWHLKYKGPSLSNPPQKRQVEDTQLLCRTYMQLVPPNSITSRGASFSFLHSQFVAQSIRWSRSAAENFSNKKPTLNYGCFQP